jgi:hypothetical protein|tara:strand:+ start:320 stop:670 length:351 start_codon:yes stop_codon:yes gene_type:complete
MGFSLKRFTDLVGIDKETSTYNTPVFKKSLEGGVLAEANNDGTIFIDKSLSGKEKQEAVEHEKVHMDQMAQGRLQYDDNTVTWKKDTKSPARVYKREDMQEGAKNLPWEDEAYKNS